MAREPLREIPVSFILNGRPVRGAAGARKTLAQFLREEMGLSGIHLGCEMGACGACNVVMDGQVVRSCLMLAPQAEGHEILTVEGLEGKGGELHPLQEAFWEGHGFQCGFCTPGILMTTVALLEENPDPTDEEIRESLSGNLCRCTGYHDVVASIREGAKKMRVQGA